MFRHTLNILVLMTLLSVLCCSSLSSSGAAEHDPATDSLNAWLEIDTAQYHRNIDYLKQIIGSQSQICVVMKGDAYGNGISTLMPVIMREGIGRVAITSNQEARDVRNAGYKGKIMRIRIATEGEVREGIGLHIEELIGNREQAELINEIAEEAGATVDFHLAINANGMSRNGLELSKGYDEALDILRLKHIHCIGMMTHYPANKDGEIVQQLNRFKQQTTMLMSKAGINRKDIILSSAATYAALYIPETRLDMVRVGSALYNYGYTERFNRFKKIMSFKSRIASIQEFPAGNTVSYKRTHKLSRPSRLANIPVGYANGLSTAMANKGYMLVRGHKCPIVGNVTMNITMIDVTDFPDIRSGDEVVIYGRQGSSEITATDIGTWTGTNLLSQSMFWAAANPKIAKK